MGVEEILGLLFVLFEVRLIGERFIGQNEAPFTACLKSASLRLERRFVKAVNYRWARPFPRTGCALRA
jgi:hypothetical protein